MTQEKWCLVRKRDSYRNLVAILSVVFPGPQNSVSLHMTLNCLVIPLPEPKVWAVNKIFALAL